MLKGLEPAIELTGGPWYTDNAWDTAYVENNMKAILMHIQDLVSLIRASISCLLF